MAEEQQQEATESTGQQDAAGAEHEASRGSPAQATTETPKPHSRAAPSPPEGRRYFWGTGRRKKSIARVRIRPGSGQFLVKGRQIADYFTQERDRGAVIAPLQAVEMAGAWDVFVNVRGGGSSGQADAVTLGLARALAGALPETVHVLRQRGLLTRDARVKERKKYGRRGARRSFQFSKR